jgi:O-antigen/teichoic acid export membrane protein
LSLKFNDAGFLFASTVVVNAGNYAINLVLGRLLGPERFAEASVIATGVLMLSFLAVGIQLTAAKFSAGYFASGESDKMALFNRWFSDSVFRVSFIVAVILAVLSPFIQSFLQFRSFVPILIIAIGIPFYFNLSFKRGVVQGLDQVKRLASTYIMEMILRFVFTFGFIFLALYYADYLSSEAVSLGFFFSFLAAVRFKIPLADKNKVRSVLTDHRKEIFQFIGVILIYELSQILINNSDVILAKHYFADKDAGLYGALALIGRVVFFGTWTIVTLLFPKVIHREKQGLPHLFLFWQSFAITMGFGLLVILACYILPETIVFVLFGEDYLSIAPLLWMYAIATTLFACANVFAYYYMSLDRYVPVVFSVIAGIIQVIGIVFYHDTLLQIIMVQIVIMFTLLVFMMLFQWYDHQRLMSNKEEKMKGSLSDLTT